MKRNKILSILLSAAMFFSAAGIPVFADEVNTVESMNYHERAVKDTAFEQTDGATEFMPEIYSPEENELTYELQSDQEDAFSEEYIDNKAYSQSADSDVELMSVEASGTCGDNLTWTLDDNGTLTISGTGNMTDYSSFTPWYNYISGITSVVIESGVTSIGSSAFYGCSSLTSITIPDSVTSIGEFAFYRCSSLTSVTIPDSVTSIGDRAFYVCSSLTSIEVDKNNHNYCSVDGNLFNKDKTELIQYAIGKTDTQYIIPDSVTSIGDRAFLDCSSLTGITIPDNVTSIGDDAFASCSSLTSITIPDSVTSIGSYAFEFCSSLTSVTIPDSVTSIGSYAFYGTAYYTDENNWENGVLYINDCLIEADFNNVPAEYEIKSGTRCIASYAFDYCSSLTSITIPYGVTNIGEFAFRACSGLTSITIPVSVTCISSYAFSGCSSLTSITIPVSVTSIGYSTFYDCSSLTSITIPDSVISIGSFAFYDCSSLTSITIPDSVISIGNWAFNGTALTDVYYGGTKEDWTKIDIGSYNECLTSADIHYNAAGISFPQIIGISFVLSSSSAGGSIQVSLTDTEYDSTMITAFYKDGVLADMQTTLISANDTEKTVPVTDTDADTAKVMIWSGTDSMKPLCESKTIDLTEVQ